MTKALCIVVPFTVPWALPYGPVVVSGLLKDAGYDTEVWDLSLDLISQFENLDGFDELSQALSIGGYTNTNVSKTVLKKVLSWTRTQLRVRLKENSPDVILLSVFSSQSLDFLIPLSSIIREILPDVYILVGGRGLDNIHRESQTNYGKHSLKYLPIDCAYMGDAENKLVEVVKSRYQGYYQAPAITGEELLNTPQAYWKGVDFSRYRGYNEKTLRVPLTASKGCVRECTFCDVAGSWPKFVYKKGDVVADEIISIYKNFGLNKIEFTDNLVNGSISNFRLMNQRLVDELPNVIDYLGYAICRTKKDMPAEDFKLASVAGAKFFKIGIESGSEKVRNDMKKKFSNDDIDWFANNCAENNIKQLWLMFCGYPTETEQDFQQTLDLLDRYQYLAKQKLVTVFLSLPMMLTTNSGFMLKYSEEYGLEHNRQDSWSDFFWTSTRYSDNTWQVRVNRWHRFMDKIQDLGYFDPKVESRGDSRQTEKITELAGLEKIYKQHYEKSTKIIPIIDTSFQFNKETHV